MSEFTLEYFVEKFERIPEEDWITDTYTDAITGACCALWSLAPRYRPLPTPKQRVLAYLQDLIALRDGKLVLP